MSSHTNPIKIVLTGGACAGKTTGLEGVREHLLNLGYQVIVVPEVATLLFNGAGRHDLSDRSATLRMQKAIIQTQIALEENFEALAGSPKCVVLCDRGVHDSKAYVSANEWRALMDDLRLDEYKLLNRYEAVIHMVTAADGANHAYKLEGQRHETLEQARAQDKALQQAYLGHGHQKIIDNSTGFDEKIRRVVAEISAILGIPEPLEKERKFLVDSLPQIPEEHSSSFIEQTYITAPAGSETRVRKRTQNGSSLYTHTTKTPLEKGIRIEKEHSISGQEYLEYLRQADPTRQTIQKLRHCFIHHGRVYELDEYQGTHKGLWTLEVEVDDLKTPLGFPSWLKVQKEVTGEKAFNNSSLALRESPAMPTV